jgi:long-subunit fatty acid transport protein
MNAGTNKGALHAYPMGSVAYSGARIGKRVAWAVGMEPIGGFGSDFRLHQQLLSGTQDTMLNYESFFAAAKFGPSIAVTVAPGFSVGASITGVYAQIRDFRMPLSMSPSAAKGLGGVAQLDPGVYGPLFQNFSEVTAYGDSKGYAGLTWAADAGVAYRSAKGMAFSASWSPQRAIRVNGGTASIDMTAQFTQLLQAMVAARARAHGETPAAAQTAVLQQLASAGLNLQAGMIGQYAAATTLTLPMTLGAGLSIPVNPSWKLAAEGEWRRWSAAESTMPFTLTNGTNANLNLMLNGSPTKGDFNYPFQLQWKDALTAKVGTSYQLASGNILRAGFIYGQNPVPENSVFIAFPAISSKAVTLGTTWKVAGFPLDLSYVHAFTQELTGSAQGHVIGSEYNASRTTMSEDVFTFGRVWKF